MAKIDKEFIAKNQFWIGLGAFVLLWLVTVVVVMASGDSAPQTKWKGAKDKIEGASKSRPKTVEYQKPWNAYGDKFRKHKDDIWQAAWDQQKDMYTWPDGMNPVPRYPSDPFGRTPPEDLNARARFRTDLYPTQFKWEVGGKKYSLDQLVLPVEFEGKFEDVFPQQTWDPSSAPSREEIWLAQEDFWVRREMLTIVRETLNAAAWFREIKPEDKEKLPEGIVGRKLFRNANWELNLLFEKPGRNLVISGRSTIKNINITGRTLALANPRDHGPLAFRLWQGTSRYDLKIAGEPLTAGSAPLPLKDARDPQPLKLAEPFLLEQVLEWEMSPVRRIDALKVAHHSHRTITSGLKVRDDLKKLDADPSAEGGADASKGTTTTSTTGGIPGSTSAPPSGGGSGMMAPPPGAGPNAQSGPGGAGGSGGQAAAGDVTRINKIPRERYLHVKEQARHLPIAMRLIVDQAYIHDVLTAVVNSRLRIQITQVTMHQVGPITRSAPPTGAGKPSEAGQQYPPGMYQGMNRFPMGGGSSGARPRMQMPGGMGMGPGPGPGRGNSDPRINPPGRSGSGVGKPTMPPTNPMGGTGGDEKSSEGSSQVQDTARLVELSIYGIATLYERPPEPPAVLIGKFAPVTVSPGKQVTATVTVVRQQGFAGDVSVSIEGLPPDVTVAPISVGASQTSGTTTLSVAPNAKPGQTLVATFATTIKHANRDWIVRSEPVQLTVGK